MCKMMLSENKGQKYSLSFSTVYFIPNCLVYVQSVKCGKTISKREELVSGELKEINPEPQTKIEDVFSTGSY